MSSSPKEKSEDSRAQIFEKLKRDLLAVVGAAELNGKTVLDLGSGPRGYCLQWAELFGKTYATDLRDFSEAYAGTPVKYVSSDGLRIDLPDSSVDVVVSHSVLEHVHKLDAVLDDVNRLLRKGGYAYLTIAPLYYSPTGLHRKADIRNWEHLDPAHPSYLAATPFFHARQANVVDMSGSPLNKLTVPEFLAAVARQPWKTLSFRTQVVKQPIPDWVDIPRFGLLNVTTKGLVFVGQKAV